MTVALSDFISLKMHMRSAIAMQVYLKIERNKSESFIMVLHNPHRRQFFLPLLVSNEIDTHNKKLTI